MSITCLRIGGNQVRMKIKLNEWLKAESWVIKCHISLLPFSLFPPLLILTKRRLNPQFWQPKLWKRQRVRGTRPRPRDVSLASSTEGRGWKAGIGKMRFLCEGWHAKKEKRVDAPTPSISEFQFCPWFSPLLRVSSLRFILLPNLRRRRLFSFSVVSQHFGVPCAQKLILASDVGDWISLSSSFDVGTRYVITKDDWKIFIDQTNTLCVCLEWRCTSRRGRTQFFFLGIRFELGTPSLATCRPTHFMVGETQKRLREADRTLRLPWLHCRCPPAPRRPSSGCKTLLAIQFSIADDWVVTGQLALSNSALQR